MYELKFNNLLVKWVPVESSYDGFTNRGNYPIVWIEKPNSSPHILVVPTYTDVKIITNNIKRVLAINGESIKYQDKEKILQWIKLLQ